VTEIIKSYPPVLQVEEKLMLSVGGQ
jgi:hypothetical protein